MEGTTNALYHPALRQLAGVQSSAKWRMFLRRMRSPRRIALSVIALALGAIWLGQTFIGMLFRQPADPANIRLWIPMSFMAYGFWHVLKTFTRQPIEPFEWTPTEKEWLIAAPFTRRQLITFRFASIAKAAVFKAACFTLIMLPDLHVLPLAFAGMLLALIFLDLLRMALEVIAYGVSARAFIWLRVAVLSIAAAVGISALAVGIYGEASVPVKATSLFALILKVANGLIYTVMTTAPGQIALKPFVKFSRIILAEQYTLVGLVHLLTSIGLVVGSGWLLISLDRWFLQLRSQREVNNFALCKVGEQDELTKSSNRPGKRKFRVPARCRGVGTLMWRQTHGIFNYPGQVAVAMILPGVLSLLPITVATTTGSMLLQVVGSLVFYSFLLMPSALRFDFRRDVDRLGVLRALPIGAWATTVGQLATPVFACSIFQFAVLLVALVLKPFPALWLVYAMLLLVPVNALIFSLENLIFMLFPYRPNQEGVGVFLRTILTFTGKGLIFGLGVVLSVAWMFAAKQWMGGGPMLFMVGMWTMTCATVGVLMMLIVRTFANFDPSQDTPPLS